MLPDNFTMGFTALKQYKRSPAHFIHWLNNPVEPTAAMRFGTLYHMAVLEPERFASEVFIMDANQRPEQSKGMTSAINKAWKEDIYSSHKYVIDTEDNQRLSEMLSIFATSDLALDLVNKGAAEQEFYAELNGVACRAKPDYVRGNAIIELKSTADASPEAFVKHSYTSLYHMQAAMYKAIIEKVEGREMTYLMIVQETAAPYNVVIYRLDEDLLADGTYRYNTLLNIHKACIRSGRWPGYEIWNKYSDGIFDLSLPAWGGKEIEVSEKYSLPVVG